MGYEINPQLKKDIHRTELDYCPYCGQIFDAAAIIPDGGTPPVPGDFSVCLKCGSFLRFDRNLKLKKLHLDEFMALESCEKQSLLHNYNMLVIYKRFIGKQDEITFKLKDYFRGS